MDFRILGPVEVVDGDRVLRLPTGRARALLAVLVLHAGEVVPAERLIDELWGEHPPPTVATIVHGLVSRLRRVLAEHTLQTSGPGYRLAVRADEVDANRFERLVHAAREADPADRGRILADALDLWRGPALADFSYEPFAQSAISALEGMRLSALEERIDADLVLGRHGDLVPEIEQLVTAHPFRERFRAQLMLALYRAGRQADALAAFRNLWTTMVDELGIEPSVPVRELNRAILEQRPSLQLAFRPASSPPARWLPRERRTVTVVVADLQPLGVPTLDPEQADLSGWRRTAVEILRRHGARVEELPSGSVVGYLGLPVAHEDDPLRAVRAAAELRTASADVRVGIDTGEVVVDSGEHAKASGPVIAWAARLQQLAHPGDVLLSPATQRLVTGATVVRPARRRGAGGAWQLASLVPSQLSTPQRPASAMVGRQSELAALRTALRAAVRAGAARRAVVVGEAGIGKSRLAEAFTDGVEARVVTGRCPPYGEGITLLPLREVVFEALGPQSWTELLQAPDLFAAVTELLGQIAAAGPVVVVFEDLHWAEPTLLDLIAYLDRRVKGAVLLVCIGRPDLLERPGWEPSRTAPIRLDALSAGELDQLIGAHGGARLAPPTRARIAAASGGNPLFAEQLLATVDDGTTDTLPPSLHSLLATRLDQLGPGERDLLRCAAIAGTECSREALTVLLPEAAGEFIDRHLESLYRKQLIQRPDGLRVEFRHVLIQVAAYRSLARDDRATLHLRLADWLEHDGAGTVPELDEVVGYHLEQVVAQRHAIGKVDVDDGVASRAGHRLADAGERAFARFDLAATANLMGRARALLPASDPRRESATARMAEACQPLGRFALADELLDELRAAAAARGDRSADTSLRLERLRTRLFLGPDPMSLDSILGEAQHAARDYERAGDVVGTGRANFVAAWVHERAGRAGAMEAAARSSLELATRSGTDARDMAAAQWQVARAVAIGSVPVPDAIVTCKGLLTTPHGTNIGVLFEIAPLLAMAGRIDEGREANELSRTIIVEHLRAPRILQFVAQAEATMAALAGDLDTAERAWREALAIGKTSEERDYLAQYAAGLACVLARRGKDHEAGDIAELSASAAPSESVLTQSMCCAARALLASRAGDHDGAVAWARRAGEWAPSEMLNLRADTLVTLAEVQAAAGPKGAQQALSEAFELYQRKGNLVAARSVSERLNSPAS